MVSTELQLEKLFQETLSEVIHRERTSFDKLAEPFMNSFVLFGAGGLGRKTLAGLRQLGVEPLAFADNNSSLWDQFIDGIKVYSPPDAINKFGHRAVFIVTIWRAGGGHRLNKTKEQLVNLGCMNIVSFAYLFWKYSDIFLPYYGIDLPHKIYQDVDEIRKTIVLWSDDSSRLEYLAQLKWRLFLDFDGLSSPVEHEQYFPLDLFLFSPDEIFVDCGAFDGDSLKSFLHLRGDEFKTYIALEPDPTNFEKLKNYISTLGAALGNKITIRQLAAASQRGKLYFDATGTASATISTQGGIEVECATLDELLTDNEPTYIKMDIEGAETDALIGAKHIIQKFKPVLAISVYHQQNHLWKIPLLVQSFYNQYNFYLRPYNEEGWDLILYAVPRERSLKKV
jgi:FkbM family methyltransferase